MFLGPFAKASGIAFPESWYWINIDNNNICTCLSVLFMTQGGLNLYASAETSKQIIKQTHTQELHHFK